MSDKSGSISVLQEAVERLHKCQAVHSKTVAVHEAFQGQTIWEGDVEVFTVKGHARATRCFAWVLLQNGHPPRCIALLDTWPVTSPGAAVKPAIAMDLVLRPEGTHWTSLGVE